MISEDLLRWANKHNWMWVENKQAFMPMPMVRVIPHNDGWIIWHRSLGAVQTDMPWSNPRAAIRIAEEVHSGRPLKIDEMRCDDD